MKIFAENLRKYRTEQGLTQKKVAQAICVDRTTYTKYENGVTVPAMDTFLLLCRALQASPNQLFGWDVEETE